MIKKITEPKPKEQKASTRSAFEALWKSFQIRFNWVLIKYFKLTIYAYKMEINFVSNFLSLLLHGTKMMTFSSSPEKKIIRTEFSYLKGLYSV